MRYNHYYNNHYYKMESRKTDRNDLRRQIDTFNSPHDMSLGGIPNIRDRYHLIKEYVEDPFNENYNWYHYDLLQDSVDNEDLLSFEYLLENVNYDDDDLNNIKMEILSDQHTAFIVVFYEIRSKKLKNT